MPGLLETPDHMFGSAKFCLAVAAEFLGSMMFAFIGSCIIYVATQVVAPPPNIVMAALGNGFMLAIAIFATANISGGHITPTVTIATMITGHIQIVKGLFYILAQIIGSVFASLLVSGLVPGSSIGMGDDGTGCFVPGAEVSNGMMFGWELVLSFILVSVVYGVAIGSPSFGNIAPLAAGLSLTIGIFAGAAFTGGGVSPARVLGPAFVFHCRIDKAFIYVAGEVVGAIIAGVLACPLYGGHAKWMDKVLGFHAFEGKQMMDGGDNMAPMVPAAMAPDDSARNGTAVEKV